MKQELPNYDDFILSLEKIHRNQEIKQHFLGLDKITDKWGVIRQVYMENIGEIMKHYEEGGWITKYPHLLDWEVHLSPIEFRVWGFIHAMPLPLYPQFPVFNWFIDFANPYYKIGVECDGKDYHDSEKDRKRDEFLAKWGWKIFRITGKECNTDFEDELNDALYTDEYDEIKTRWWLESHEGLLSAIKQLYFTKDVDRDKVDVICYQTLNSHKLADFEL